ncbi:MAG: PAS domain S-box protein [Kangiellaceae bacterium]|nr:PAS domain S-box protein [Kangiellaceae bacterium]
MKKTLIAALIAFLILYFTGLGDGFVQLFKDEEGRTNWQHVANWSSGILIILLSITAIILFNSRRAKQRANAELNAIKDDLEIRVKERTATLDESNQKLKEEVENHLATTKQLHASEHYINSILESMPSMLVGLNPKGEITQWNKKAEKYTGVKIEDAIGKNLWKAYPIITVTPNQVREALTKPEPTIIRQNQRGLFHFDITIYPLHGTGESGVVLLLDDVSQQVKSENKLIQRDKISSMGELASSMAHDMSAPLQGMLTDIKQIEAQVSALTTKDDESAAKISESLLDAIVQGKQASAIIDNLLDFAGSQQKDKQAEDMAEVMDHSIDLAKSVLSLPQGMNFCDVLIEKEYDGNLPKVSCHVSEIQQVYLSLLRHCFHSLAKVEREDFKPTIRVRILECYGALWLKVSHNGLGLSGEEQQSIFEPFFSNLPMDNEYDADKRLSFSHFVITEHHQGQMAVTSDINVGTTFHIQFD